MFLKYHVVGTIAFSIDFLVYVFVMTIGLLRVIAKSIGSLCGIALSFNMNKKFTFKITESKNGKIKFSVLYWPAIWANLVVNSRVISFYPASTSSPYFVAVCWPVWCKF